MSRAIEKPILISGAGPSGLAMALWLRRQGIAYRIIDKALTPGTTSRAIAVQARTLEFYRMLGIDREIVEAGVRVSELVLRRRGRVVTRAEIGNPGKGISPFPYLLFLSQDIHEGILNDRLARMGVTIERGVEFIGLSQRQDGVSVQVHGPNGTETIEASYLVGCDGASSPVRHALGIEFPGGTYSQVFYVADVVASGEALNNDVQINDVQISVSYEDFCIIMPIKKLNTLRLTGIVPPASERKPQITFEDVAESVKRNTGLSVSQVNWFSTYHVHHRVAERFTVGRVFIAGDAGHIHSPAGGQGMNTGIGDALNLAWKLAEVTLGRASSTILDTYEPERMAFARLLVQTTDTAFKFIASRSWLGSIWRAYALPFLVSTLTRLQGIRKFMYRTISQTRIEYIESPLSNGGTQYLESGERLPYVEFDSAATKSPQTNFDALKNLQWQVHVYGRVNDAFRSEITATGPALHEFEFNSDAQAKGFKKDAFYLVRPDGYIGLAHETQDATRLRNYLKKWGLS